MPPENKASSSRDGESKIPVLLLKTKSAPADAYEQCFSALDDGKYEPMFVPVLEHRFKQDALDTVRQHIMNRDFAGDRPKYGAMIFTSQRAVEAFARIVEEIRSKDPDSMETYFPKHMPLYVVGPATARGLKSLNMDCPVLGEETGNGEALAAFILEHYNTLYTGEKKPRTLFLVGEKRRDVIPKTLQSPNLPADRLIPVDELEIYETGEMESFYGDFTQIWKANAERKVPQWIVVFSPTGCKAMLESIGIRTDNELNELDGLERKMLRVATIGPTTKEYLHRECHFQAHAMAPSPTPEGLAEAMKAYEEQLATSRS